MTHTTDPSNPRRNLLALIGGPVLAGAVSGAVRALVTWLLDR
ncbi:hypothetical protein AB0M57_10920 [Streptomyces sp. NPDC051597]